MMPDEYQANDILLEQATGEFDESAPVAPIPVVLGDAVVTNEVYPQHITFYTLVLTAAAPRSDLAGLDPLRTGLAVRALDHDVVLCHSLQQAQDTANLDVTLAAPNGAILSSSETAPTYLRATPHMWVVANTYPTRVTVIAERRAA